MREGNVSMGTEVESREGGTEKGGRHREGGKAGSWSPGPAQMQHCVGLGKGTQSEPTGGST